MKFENIIFWSLIYTICLPSGVASVGVCGDVRPASSVQNMRYTGEALLNVDMVGLQQCKTMCRRRSDCLGINYDQGQLACKLLSNSTSYNPTLLTSDTNCVFHLDEDDEGAGQAAQICQKSSCPESHVCVPLTSGQSICLQEPAQGSSVPAISVAVLVAEPTGCMVLGFMYIPEVNMCVLMVSTGTTWTDAKMECEGYTNGGLVVLDTADKQTTIMEILEGAEYQPPNYWVGAERDEGFTVDFLWRTGGIVSPQPVVDSVDQMCVAMFSKVFVDHPCGNSEKYICEVQI